MPVILLIDNGSVREHATRQLRKLAETLSDKTGHTIHPVSLKDADRISAEKLDGKPAQIFRTFMKKSFLMVKLNLFYYQYSLDKAKP